MHGQICQQLKRLGRDDDVAMETTLSAHLQYRRSCVSKQTFWNSVKMSNENIYGNKASNMFNQFMPVAKRQGYINSEVEI